MANSAGINGTALFAALAGSILVYSAVKGNKVSVTVRDLLKGQTPATNYGTAASGASVGAGIGTGSINSLGSIPTGSGGNQFSTIDAFMVNTLGFSKAGRAGALGNIQVESTFSPTAYNPGEGAIGICQWEKGRRVALQTLAASMGTTETDIRAQLRYMQTELMSAFSPVYVYMRAATDPASAAAFWDGNYEISDGKTRSERVANAQSIYGSLK